MCLCLSFSNFVLPSLHFSSPLTQLNGSMGALLVLLTFRSLFCLFNVSFGHRASLLVFWPLFLPVQPFLPSSPFFLLPSYAFVSRPFPPDYPFVFVLFIDWATFPIISLELWAEGYETVRWNYYWQWGQRDQCLDNTNPCEG